MLHEEMNPENNSLNKTYEQKKPYKQLVDSDSI
jgi:hypothetical protein